MGRFCHRWPESVLLLVVVIVIVVLGDDSLEPIELRFVELAVSPVPTKAIGG
jgi:hypothetical protein